MSTGIELLEYLLGLALRKRTEGELNATNKEIITEAMQAVHFTARRANTKLTPGGYESYEERTRFKEKRLRQGLCVKCGKNPINRERSRRMCTECLDYRKDPNRKKRNIRRWTPEELLKLAQMKKAGKTYEEIGKALGRTKAAVLQRIRYTGEWKLREIAKAAEAKKGSEKGELTAT